MRPADKRKARQEADKLRTELRQLEERLVRLEASKAGGPTSWARTRDRIEEIKRMLTSLNIK